MGFVSKLSVNPVFTDSLLRDVAAIPFDINIQEKEHMFPSRCTYVKRPFNISVWGYELIFDCQAGIAQVSAERVRKREVLFF